MINETLNQTINSTAQNSFFAENIPVIVSRAQELILAPSQFPEMIWMVIPLIAITFIMTFYFSTHKFEELGWNTAVSNSMIGIFVAIDLLRYMYNLTFPGTIQNWFIDPLKLLVVAGIVAESLFLVFTDWLHFLPKKVAFFISSPLPVNLTSYVVMTIVYTDVAVDFYTLFAALVLFFVLLIVLYSIKVIIRVEEKRKLAINSES